MSSSLHQRSLNKPNTSLFPKSQSPSKPYTFFNRTSLLLLLTLLILLGVFSPYLTNPSSFFPSSKASFEAKWRRYSLPEAVAFVAKNDSIVIVCAVSEPYLPFLNNWLISIVRQKHHDKVLVIAEDYSTLFIVNGKWPGHAVLIPPAPDAQVAHKFGSQGFFNFTSRRPRHLLQILELGYSVMYNDVDMVWLADPFPYLKGEHDVYFMDDMTAVSTDFASWFQIIH